MLYENIIKRESNLDKNDKVQNAYENMLNEGGKEKSEAIREIIKKNFKLTSRDVSVKTGGGAMSTAIRVTIKTAKAVPYMKKIKEISSGHERYTRDAATGSILGGGNTFIFTELDWKFRNKLVNKIESEMKKQMTDDYLNDIGTNSVKVFGYDVVKEKGAKVFWIPDPKTHTVGQTNMNVNQAAGRVLSLMIDNEDTKNLKKIG